MIHKVSLELGSSTLSIETGKLAKQAGGAAYVRFGDSVVLATATANQDAREGIDFFPLTVDYREYTYAAGRIPGGYIKREGRMSEKETLTSRLIDRPLRPLFEEGFKCETQIVAMVLSADADNDPDVLAICGASAALSISDIPFHNPIAAVRVGKIEGKLVVNPTHAERATRFGNRAAVDQRRQQQHDADGRHFGDASDPDEAGVDPHKDRDRDGAEHREGSPRAAHQGLDHDQRQHCEKNHHDQQHTDQRNGPRHRPHLRADHVAERAAVAPGRQEQHCHVLNGSSEYDAGQDP